MLSAPVSGVQAPVPVLISGTVAMVEHLGADVFAHVAVAGLEPLLIVRLDGEASVRNGANVAVSLDPARVHAFGSDGGRVDIRRPIRSAA